MNTQIKKLNEDTKNYYSWSFSLLAFSVAYDFAAQDKFDKKSPVLD